MPTATEIVILAFAASNGLRVVAYVPQIVKLARDESGAAAVSSCTWMLFLVSNLSTAAYASVVLDEPWMTLVFTTNAAFSAAIVVLAVLRHRNCGKQSAVTVNRRIA